MHSNCIEHLTVNFNPMFVEATDHSCLDLGTLGAGPWVPGTYIQPIEKKIFRPARPVIGLLQTGQYLLIVS
ncbi:MAG: hypothetical protein K9M08_15855 [Pirellula sp.]|nr:hypothetical protein [Pirellula sp.]